MRDFDQEIIDIISAGGEDCALWVPGDAAQENAARTTLTSKGVGALAGLILTYRSAITSWDAPIIHARNQNRTPFPQLNGVDEGGTSPDAAAWSRDDAGGANGFSIGALVNFINATGSRILAKDDDTDNEWEFTPDSNDRLNLILEDDSAGVLIQRRTVAAVVENITKFVSTTYDGTGGASATDGAVMYEEGIPTTSSAINNASYVGMEDLTSPVGLGQKGNNGNELNGFLGIAFFTHRVLSASEMFNLNDIYEAMQRAQRSRLLAGVL